MNDRTKDENGDNEPVHLSASPISKSEKRRKLIRSIAASGGIAATGLATTQWIKPVVNSVVLPAHAISTTERFDVIVEVAVVTTSIMDYFIDSSHAGAAMPCPIPLTFCVDISSPSMVNIKFLNKMSGDIGFTNGVNFGPVNIIQANNGGTLADYTLNPITITGNTITGKISCGNATPMKVDSMADFDGVLVPGNCAVIVVP